MPILACRKWSNPRMELDVQGALTRLGGRKDLYLKMLRRVEPEFGDVRAAIDRSLAEKDFATARRLAHSTKGVAGSIGAMDLFEAASKLERAIYNQSPQIDDLLVQFQSALDASCDSISAFLANPEQFYP